MLVIVYTNYMYMYRAAQGHRVAMVLLGIINLLIDDQALLTSYGDITMSDSYERPFVSLDSDVAMGSPAEPCPTSPIPRISRSCPNH